ncbi:MAG: glucose sorbosone dehydrogenase [Candidatus Levybacteria bacterium RIFCSPLOWO2_12_FULL_37_14]|nr:MAG: Quinoprotein glucose dehydrogenase [Candidatus Levybacteria bacterium GW2011_GWA1_37_16]KKQ42763.1 MAG: Quinoprotein glucose dehydrogenase [Candidatus Levybacteria bacterium GW2011_GWB1_37_8]OGH51098.1 MAG: glucose sorbosone dehydrogenase [Candidatus Levybacteria bacterium RIFCSPLOWO2_12_FULL_37_14]
MSNKKMILIILAVLLILSLVYINLAGKRQSQITVNTPSLDSNEVNQAQNDIPRLSILADNLEIPWALVFLPDKSILFTERAGRVRIIDNEGNLNPNLIAVISDVKHSGEGGLLGIAIHPDFSANHFVYLYYTYSNINDNTLNRVARFEFENNKLQKQKIIVDGILGASNHNGGRIKFGPDNFLYITTGDAQEPSLAQNINSLAGKILRITDEGRPALDNPFGNLVFSFGHRNPQGLAWDNQNQLWETEHGPSALDELNIIEAGKNYGWPTIQGNQKQAGMESPILNSGSGTWAPSGTAFLNGSIFFAGLRGEALFEYKIAEKKLIPHLKGEIGRIREVVVGPASPRGEPENLLYITTSNRDGRGTPDNTDDKIIRINPAKL